jgi:hypothetical protein
MTLRVQRKPHPVIARSSCDEAIQSLVTKDKKSMAHNQYPKHPFLFRSVGWVASARSLDEPPVARTRERWRHPGPGWPRGLLQFPPRVVPANAGTHTPCHLFLALGQIPCVRSNAEGYGSRRSPGRLAVRSCHHARYFSIQESRKPSLTPIAVVIRFLILQLVMVGNSSSSIHATGTSSTSIFCTLS